MRTGAAATVGRRLAIIGAALVALGALAAWQLLAAINAVAAIGSHRIVEGLAYGALPRQAFDLYRPDGAPPARALRQSGQVVTLREYDGVDHLSLVGAIAAPLRRLAPVLDDILAFVAAVPPT